ncbi:CYTH and CHAD domain-containing protein [Corynebacterium guangdongense]|uniref:CHAD domain-containing protein n=1 Tax=Corynebacterium guangdongense TaxID=1783348 RepID=A0ABU1ZY04_9CORY|nr:CYTH and CHAD domain-containing protein [Corynebacterium guangdongense]MDR7329813.1 CHAD domain-containing protein [Corynebacterium guangdongense]WJZ18376.1 CHAD domain protein [Corynebacterium guangdongense]
MAINKFHEVEIKFAVDGATTVPDLTRLPEVESIGSTREHRLSAIYYDTRDLRLTREKITLRRRTGGEDDGWHIKLPADSGRIELHAELGDPVNGVYHVPDDLLAQVRAIVRNHELAPVAQVDNHRTESTLCLADGTPIGEFCDDRVTAWSLLPGGAQTSWRECEVELAEPMIGTDIGADFLHSITELLIGAGARRSSSPSKLAAALGDSVDHAPVPAHLRDPDLDEDSAAAGVITALRANRDKLIEYDPKVRRDEWDSVHQMRVATRELRSHMETFDGVLAGEAIKQLLAELKILASILGRARDAEVVEERFHALLDAEDSDVIDATAREHIREDMGAEYRRAHRHVVAALDSDRYLDMLDAIDELLADPPLAGAHRLDEDEVTAATGRHAATDDADTDTSAAPAEEEPELSPEEVLLSHLEEAYRKLLKRHRRAVDNWDNHELTLHEREDYFHDMRKSAKKLRYAAEAVGAATRVKTKRLYKACKDLQSSLGDFQDSVTSRDKLVHLAQAADRRGESTFAYGLLYQRERFLGLQALEEYKDGVKQIKASFGRLKLTKKK